MSGVMFYLFMLPQPFLVLTWVFSGEVTSDRAAGHAGRGRKEGREGEERRERKERRKEGREESKGRGRDREGGTGSRRRSGLMSEVKPPTGSSTDLKLKIKTCARTSRKL
jgi:hypothetical protein